MSVDINASQSRKRRRRNRSILAYALVVIAMIAGPVYAGTCSYTADYPAVVTITPTLTGSITVGRDVPVGTEVYRATFNTGVNSGVFVDCQPGNYQDSWRYATRPRPASGYVHPQWGVVYQTSVPGIGAVMWNAGNGFPTSRLVTYAVTTRFAPARAVDISLVKTGPVTGGIITAADLPTAEFVKIGDNTLRLLLTNNLGSLNVVARTCTTPDVSVDLGTHYTKELTGVGSTTAAWVDVPIRLNNCPAFFDAFRNDGIYSPGISPVTPRASQLSYRVDPVTSVVNPAQGVMALQPDGVNPTAQGIGIQIADAGNNPVSYGTTRASGLALTEVDGQSYTIPLKARYYQTEATTVAGQANGAATVTLIYN
jgi:type 1 fimbria pilin